MFDIGGWEVFVIAALALIVIGPKELPRVVRNVGRWVAKARSLAREFQTGMEDAAREADLDELRKTANLKSSIERDIRQAGAETKRSIETQMEAPRAAASRPAAPAKPAAAPQPVRREPSAAAPPPGEADEDTVLRGFERGVRGRGYSADD